MFVEHLPDDRGQAHTLEAFTAALLLVAGLVFATQATAVTPLSASTSNQHVENQAAIAAQDVLTTAEASGELRAALLYYDDGFVGADDEYYTGLPNASHPLHGQLREAFDNRRIAFDVDVYYPAADGEGLDRTRMIDMGSPSDNAATASTRVALYGDDRFGDSDQYVLADDGPGGYFAAPVGAGDTLYTVVEVRITAWQM
ncbi:hypothetical protein EXE43_11580 [Halorubrum sp. SS5]|uniref:Uncharacterized protein n=1 Tax=Halorubrum salinarum TaxID=2739057 RepID=A0A7D4D0Y6_9EURY|nr:hypothetical protein [Halorubrum salinarum]QKG93883.1 hypothetical protein HPS36_13815 [Halorubrum salinarum]TKX85827.1 hypothetical protein EXE43_11580 [Halorubrum sp. SS5]